MKIHRSTGYIHVDLTVAEAMVLLEELSNVRGGSRLPKLRQVCEGLGESIALAIVTPKRPGRPSTRGAIIPQVAAMRGAATEPEESKEPVDETVR